MVTQEQDEKITYSTMSVGQAEALNRAFGQALDAARGQLGREYPIYIGGQRRTAGATFEDRSPNDTRVVLGTFQDAGDNEAREAVEAARHAFDQWSHTPWQERLVILRRAADNFRARKYEIGAWLAMEAGKTRLEALGEVEEAADLITAYSGYMEQNNGYVRKMNQLSPEELNHSVLRPYGVWIVIAPFNFPAALATGMIAGALIGGNTVVFKPSHETPLTGAKVYECLVDAGLPAGALNYLTGYGASLGAALTTQEQADGVAFIGSARVGCQIAREFTQARPRPVVAEMGGKNPVIVTDHADLDKAVEGTTRAAFGYSGQKCSAASRVYVLEGIADEFIRRFVDRTNELVVGDPVDEAVFMGPVINENAYKRFAEAADRSRRDGKVLTGGHQLTGGDLRYGYYCEPTIAQLPAEHPYFQEELFVPLIAITTVTSLDEAIRWANASEYGLTAGIFSEDESEVQTFLDRIEAGVVYVNRKAGATTGAWPDVQSFGGWKSSGSTGKSALGAYYVPQFMHEQNQTVVSD